MNTRWTVLLLLCAAFAGCGREEAKTPEEIAAGSAPAASSSAPPAAPKKMVENVGVSDMTPQTAKPTKLKPVAETERAEVTRPAETPAPPLPLARTEPQAPAPQPKPADAEPAKPEPGDEWGPFAALDGERRRDRRRRSSGRGPASVVLPPPFLGGGFGNGAGSGAGFGSDPIAPPDFGGAGADAMSDGSEYASGTPLGGYEFPSGSDFPDGYGSGGYNGDFYPPGYGDEFDLTGDDLAGATDDYFPPPRSGPTGGHDGPTGPSDGGLQPTPPIPPPDF